MNEKAEKKIDENKGGNESENRGKYTEQKLRDRGVSKFIGTQ